MTFSAAKRVVELILNGHTDHDSLWRSVVEARDEARTEKRPKVNGSSIILDHDQSDLFL